MLSVVHDFRSGFQTEMSFQIFLGVVVLGIVVFGLIVRMGTLYALSRFSQMRCYSISARPLSNFLHQPYVWFLNRHTADLSENQVPVEVDRVVNEAMIPAMRMLPQVGFPAVPHRSAVRGQSHGGAGGDACLLRPSMR